MVSRFSAVFGLVKKNTPQFALWIEDTSGHYLATIFVTHKIATEGWIANKGNRRKEALPHWCFQRGQYYDDGLMSPTKEEPLPDGISGATPKVNTNLQILQKTLPSIFVLKAEFNHSTDFNDYFPKEAEVDAENYSGGEFGSGQPAIVYAATIDNTKPNVACQLIGYSSPDGSDGSLRFDTEKLSSALLIVKQITVEIK